MLACSVWLGRVVAALTASLLPDMSGYHMYSKAGTGPGFGHLHVREEQPPLGLSNFVSP